MDFQNTNDLNNRLNLLSGNLLPIADSDTTFPLIWRMYNILIRLIQLIHMISFLFGVALSPLEKSLKNGTVCAVHTVEEVIMFMQLYTRKKLLKQMIRQLNDILNNADDTMKDIVKSTLTTSEKLFITYGLVHTTTIILWTVQPAMLAFEKDEFYYVDYNLPCAFSPEPFSRSVLVVSSVFMSISSTVLFMTKFGMDVYMMHLVLMLTAQYRYTATKLMLLFRNLQEDDAHVDKTLGANQRAEKELRAMCQHHNMVLR